MLERIAQELNNRGYVADVQKVIKNGVNMQGISVGQTENVRPVFYKEDKWDDMEITDIANEIESRYEQVSIKQNINVDTMADPEFMKKNVRMCVQRKSNEDICKRDYLDMELYLRCIISNDSFDGIASYKLPKQYDSEELWDAAIENTRKELKVRSLASFLMKIIDEDDVDLMNETGMYVVTNNETTQGGVSIYYTDILKELCEKANINELWVMPSSIHEIMIKRCDEETWEDMNGLVHEVNTTKVDPQEQLSDHVYLYKADTDEIIYKEVA